MYKLIVGILGIVFLLPIKVSAIINRLEASQVSFTCWFIKKKLVVENCTGASFIHVAST